MVLHMLRNYVGDRAFFTALNHYLVYNEYGTVEIHDLRLAFEEVTGEDLNWFFNQWFLSSGHPELTIEQHLDDGVLTVEVTQTQVEPSPIFFLPVNIRCWTSEDDFWDLPVEISDSYQKFEFDIDEPVKLVLFDSEQQLLAKVNHQKSLEEWIFQYYYGEKLMARYGALEQLGELALESPEQYDTVTTVYLNALVEDPFWGIRELAAEFFDEYTGPFIDEVNERLEKIALEDKKSQVRASALTSLISENPDDHKPLILKCMEDSSYMVKGAAILAYSATNDINKVKVLDQYKEDKNSHIVFALAEFYSSENQFDNSTWFLDRMKKATTEDLFYLLQYYGVFLSQAGIPQEKLDEGMEFLKQKALAHPIVFIRLAAFQSLQILPATETQKSIIEEIKRNETSEDLLKLYNGNN